MRIITKNVYLIIKHDFDIVTFCIVSFTIPLRHMGSSFCFVSIKNMLCTRFMAYGVVPFYESVFNRLLLRFLSLLPVNQNLLNNI